MGQDQKPQRFFIDTEEKLAAWTGDIPAWNAWGAAEGGDGFEPLEEGRPVHPYLKGEAAMALWRAGLGDWNAWVEKNPVADVDFNGQTFEANVERRTGEPLIDFRGFRFPEGNVGFWLATFGEGEVSFAGATFGEGNVNFDRATFGEGDVSFTLATFGDGDVSFDDAILGEGDVDFRATSFGNGQVSFGNLAFQGTARFTGLGSLDKCTKFSFEGCSFEKLFTFSHYGRMGCPLDLRRTSIKHDVVVHDVHCDYGSAQMPKWARLASAYWSGMPQGAEPLWKWATKADDPKDAQRFRKLKELAAGNRNHAKALEFHTSEIQTARGHYEGWLKNAGQSLAQFLYWVSSQYGRSVWLPLVWLGVMWRGFGEVYWWMRTDFADFSDKACEAVAGLTRDGGTALGYSGSNMLAFIPTGAAARTQGINLLYGGQVPDAVLLLGAVQSVVSAILLFLLGLALRNMFRV